MDAIMEVIGKIDFVDGVAAAKHSAGTQAESQCQDQSQCGESEEAGFHSVSPSCLDVPILLNRAGNVKLSAGLRKKDCLFL